MSEQQYEQYVDRELRRLNEIIDYNIIHGYGYKRESAQHKALLKKAKVLKRKQLFKNITNLFSFFF